MMPLKCCPYCGRVPFDGYSGGLWYIRCSNWACAGGPRTYRYTTWEAAAEDWNNLTEDIKEKMRKEGKNVPI